MCAPVIVGEVRPLNVALICICWAVGSSTTVATPVPGDGTGLGSSLAPERLAVKVIGVALAVAIGNANAVAITAKDGKHRILASGKFLLPAPRCCDQLHDAAISF